jgi:flavorubredoxin
MVRTYRAAPDLDVITSEVPIPGFGLVPINAFVLHGAEPVLVDTGAVVHHDEFLAALRSVIDPHELRWIWLTHTDLDHIGTLHTLLTEHPQIRVVTTFLGVGIMSLYAPLPMDRVNLVNPGERLVLGDRTLLAFRPPAFDNPVTTGFHDDRTGALFSSDCFGALLDEVPTSASDLTPEQLRAGQVFWATVDSPWLHQVDRAGLARQLDEIRRAEPTYVLSSHLPAAPGSMVGDLIASLAAAPDAEPFVGPNQEALEQMLAHVADADADADDGAGAR